MSRIALVSSEPIRERMAGIGIRYLELARRLPREGIEVVLISPAAAAESAALGLDAAGIRRFEAGKLAEILRDCDAAVAQGQLANHVAIEVPDLPKAFDLYDPWLVENLHYTESLGLDPYRNDHASWVLQLSQGDFFLCSCEEQRTFYLGFLAALGRLNPPRTAEDPDLDRLIAAVPFGVDQVLPPHRPLLPPRREGEKRILFGGLYDWYDPWTLLAALEGLEGGDLGDWSLFLIKNPNPESTPQRLLAEVEERCRRSGWWESRVRFLDWVDAERRFDLLRDVDVLAAPHRLSIETRLSLRTRYLEALAAGLPVITTEGGTLARLLKEHGAGWVVPEGDAAALGRALGEALGDEEAGHGGGRGGDRRREGARTLLASFEWERAMAPLVEFCREPWRDSTKEDFAFKVPTRAPGDPLGFRLKRWMRRSAGGV